MKITKELLEELYISQELSVRECAKKLGLPSHGAISWGLKKFGIKARPARFQKGNTFNKIKKGKESPFYKGGKIEQKCKECGKSFKIFPSQKSAFTRCDECKKKRFDLTGKKFDLLEVIKQHSYAKGGHIIWLCKCECGNTKTIRSADLKSGRTKSCGCEQGQKGEKNINWLGGGFCGYDTYADRLSFAEEIRKSPNDEKVLQVKCAYCGRWLSPSVSQVSQRIRVLFGQKGHVGECRFYCSDNCKKACPVYRKILWPEGYKPATSREVQPELRQMRLALDNYECQRCGISIEQAELHCHHYTGTVQNPIESADLDNTVTVCKNCHKWVHTQEGCKYFQMRCDKKKGNITKQSLED